VEKSHRPDASGHNILEEGSDSPGSLVIAISLRPLPSSTPVSATADLLLGLS
jgi:hypothetical protein